MHGISAPPLAALGKRLAYKVREVAHLLGVSERYVWTLVDRGDLESCKIGNRRLVPADALEAFLSGLREDERRARAAATGEPVENPDSGTPARTDP